jgi:hypothetical protein
MRARGRMAPDPFRSCLILGGANSRHRDREAAFALFTPDLVIACNHAFRDEPGRVDHAVTMHPELYPKWIAAREEAGFPPAGKLWHSRHHISKVGSEPIESWGGSSGMLCIRVALTLGCNRIVLAGIPMEKMMRHYDDDKPWHEARQYWPAWERAIPQFHGRVRSLSGWTREKLGAPDMEWLHGNAA